jgi:hypothetical protein
MSGENKRRVSKFLSWTAIVGVATVIMALPYVMDANRHFLVIWDSPTTVQKMQEDLAAIRDGNAARDSKLDAMNVKLTEIQSALKALQLRTPRQMGSLTSTNAIGMTE